MTSGRGRIVYEDARKPLLEGFPGKISISHSASMVAVMISDLECGIDVEETSRNVDRIASRFLCQEELDWTAVSNNPAMARIVCWSAKEAIFKWAGISNTDFRRDIQIMPFPIAGQGPISAIHRSGDHISSLALNYFFELNNAVVWCVE
jgi:phosphopantetheinyl transferase